MSKQCTTHHHACDCREAKFRKLERENAALRKDKERLDYLEKNIDFIGWRFYGKPCHFDLRSTIDVKRKEIQT
jgi:hypothetical protein